MYCRLCRDVMKVPLLFSNIFKPSPIICQSCLSNLERVEGGCLNCGKKTIEVYCEDCQYWKETGVVIKQYALYYYNEFVKSLIEQVKYNGDLRVLQSFRYEVKRFYKRVIIKSGFKPDVAVPVPLSQRKYTNRGFNQAMVIAKFLPCPIDDALIKTHDFTQSQRSRKERLSASGDFKLKESIDLRGKHVLIVDDIYTTGSTIHQIASLLQSTNPSEIRSFTLFRS